jgi:Mg2+ and Co2+ transporter CorA
MAITGRLFNADRTDEEVSIGDLDVSELSDRQLLWLDIGGSDDKDKAEAGRLLGLDQRSLDHVGDRSQLPGLRLRRTYFELTVTALDDKSNPLSLTFFAGRNWVVTAHEQSVPFLERYRDLLGPDTEIGQLNAPSFLAALLDWQVGTYFHAVDDLEKAVDRLDERALKDDDQDDVLRDLIEVRRRTGDIRRLVTSHREVFAALTRADFEVIATSESAAHFQSLATRLENAISAVENARELLIGSFDILMSRTSQRTNDIMRILTIISVILLPAVVLAGVMGMNFHVPFFDQPDLFWVTLALMIGVAILVLVVARRARWI